MAELEERDAMIVQLQRELMRARETEREAMFTYKKRESEELPGA